MNKPTVNEKAHSSRRNRRGAFTLVELLVVMAIAAILAGSIIGGYWMMVQKYKGQAASSRMMAALSIVDTLKNDAPVRPDHRLANYYWIETDLTQADNPAYDATTSSTARRMSSGEFFVFQARQYSKTQSVLESLGPDCLQATLGRNGAAREQLPDANHGMVLVFEQAPAYGTVVSKKDAIDRNLPNYSNQKFLLVSSDPAPIGGQQRSVGWQLRGIVDPWGREMLYRYMGDAAELNNEVDNVYEDIAEDEQLVPPLESRASGRVRPAVAAHPYPFIMSAGPDGQWGAFVDGVAPAFARDAAMDKREARDVGARDNIYSQEAN